MMGAEQKGERIQGAKERRGRAVPGCWLELLRRLQCRSYEFAVNSRQIWAYSELSNAEAAARAGDAATGFEPRFNSVSSR